MGFAKKLSWYGVLALAAAGACWPSVARATCLDDARAAHTAAAAPGPAQIQGPGCFVAKDGTLTDTGGAKACPAGAHTHYYFEEKAQADAQGKAVDALRTACPLFHVVGIAGKPAPAPAKPAGHVDEAHAPNSEKENINQLTKLLEETSPSTVVKNTSATSLIRKMSPKSGTGTGATDAADVAAEAVQILGQIVVDRASQAAYRMLSEKIQQGLACFDDKGVKNVHTHFPATCDAVASLRIQELAMSRDVLLRALTADIVNAALAKALEQARSRTSLKETREGVATLLVSKQADAKAWTEAMKGLSDLEGGQGAKALERGLSKASVDTVSISNLSLGQSPDLQAAFELIKGTLVPIIIGTISNPGKERSGDAARAIVAEIESFALSTGLSTAQGQPWEPFMLAAAALVKCRARIATDEISTIAACDVSREVDGLDGSAPAKKVARSLARSLQLALVAKVVDQPDPDRRLVAALSGVFDATCYAADMTKTLGCPALLDVAPDDYSKTVMPLALARGMLEAAVERDTNRMVTTAVVGLENVIVPELAKSTDGRTKKRALRLIAGVVAYAGTFETKTEAANNSSKADLHEQRTKILESLTADMTDRQDREGDVILSLGGSLSLVGGVRAPFGGGTPVYNGPFSLSLGLGLQNVPQDWPIGWHLELGLLDLAQYLSYQATPGDSATKTESKVEVRKPEVKDAVSPSLKVGIQWGRDVPFFLAAGFGYAPFYEFKKADGTVDSRGAFTASATFGAYVPLLDLN